MATTSALVPLTIEELKYILDGLNFVDDHWSGDYEGYDQVLTLIVKMSEYYTELKGFQNEQ